MNPINPVTVPRCSLSATTRPRITISSHSVICSPLAFARAARNRATFCSGVSPAGPLDDDEDGGGNGDVGDWNLFFRGVEMGDWKRGLEV